MKILLPLSWIYGGIMAVRNLLFDYGFLSQTTFGIPIISVGNLAVGGTGKTPHSEYLLRLLGQQDKHHCALLSRGYGRKTKGYYEAKNHSAQEVGDEPWQIQSKFPQARVCVCEKRVKGIQELMSRHPQTEVIVLDDAYQHRYVKPGLSILLTDFSRLFTDDYVMPAGRLREFRNGYKRANIIIVTKCPEALKEEEQRRIIDKLSPMEGQEVFFTRFDYGQRYAFSNHQIVEKETTKGNSVLLLCGIAQPGILKDFLSKQYQKVHMVEFPDHHNFSDSEIKKLTSEALHFDKIVTTEKDAARLSAYQLPKTFSERLWIQPIEVTFLNNKSNQFNKIISDYVTENSRNSTVD